MKPPADFSQLARIAESLIDQKTGVIRYIEPVERDAGGPAFFHYRGEASNTAAFVRQKNFADTGGAATSRERAAAKAIGEAIERYCSAIYNIEGLPLFSFEQAPFDCTAPEEYALYSPEQYNSPGFPWAPFEKASPIRWTAAVDLKTKAAVHVPAARVYMPYSYYAGTGDTPIDQPISTGLACHIGYAAAVRTAICEVVERDAVLITWQAMLAPPQIRIETLSEENYDLVQRFEATGATVFMFDLTLDHGVPTVLAVLRNSLSSAAALVFAASASPSAEDAVRKSLEELAHTARYCQTVKSHAPRLVADPPEFSCVTDQMTHLNFYVDHAHTRYTDFLFKSDKRRDFSELRSFDTGDAEAEVEGLVSRIHDVGHRVLVTDLTTSDIEPLGLCVVRAVIPGFQPLHMGYRLRALGGQRLWTVPQRLGYRGITRETGDNPAPHPYP